MVIGEGNGLYVTSCYINTLKVPLTEHGTLVGRAV